MYPNVDSSGMNGCFITLNDEVSVETFDEECKADFKGLGWVTNGKGKFNNQPIVKNVYFCKFCCE